MSEWVSEWVCVCVCIYLSIYLCFLPWHGPAIKKAKLKLIICWLVIFKNKDDILSLNWFIFRLIFFILLFWPPSFSTLSYLLLALCTLPCFYFFFFFFFLTKKKPSAHWLGNWSRTTFYLISHHFLIYLFAVFFINHLLLWFIFYLTFWQIKFFYYLFLDCFFLQTTFGQTFSYSMSSTFLFLFFLLVIPFEAEKNVRVLN